MEAWEKKAKSKQDTKTVQCASTLLRGTMDKSISNWTVPEVQIPWKDKSNKVKIIAYIDLTRNVTVFFFLIQLKLNVECPASSCYYFLLDTLFCSYISVQT